MLQIHRFNLTSVDGSMQVEMPMGARILHVGVSNDGPCLWALVDPAAPKISRELWALASGDPIDVEADLINYIGTVQAAVEGKIITIHVLEILPLPAPLGISE